MSAPPPAPIDIEEPRQLTAWLQTTCRIGPEEVVVARRLSGGVSNRTVLVTRSSGEAWVLKQALARLRVAVEWRCPPERIYREAAGMRWLGRLCPAGSIPEFLFEDRGQHLLAMRAVPEPHQVWKSLLLQEGVHPDHFTQFGTLLGELQRNAGPHRHALEREFGDREFFEQLRLEPFYRYSATTCPPAADFLHRLIVDTRREAGTLVHGDYSPKNVLIREERLVLLDHEVIHWGDAAFDPGFALAHLLSKAHHLSRVRATLLEGTATFWRAYEGSAQVEKGVASTDLEARVVRHALGCLLARVVGRSPVDYLTREERARQTSLVVRWMEDPPERVLDLLAAFAHDLRTDSCHVPPS